MTFKKILPVDELRFLLESNKIERVYDEKSYKLATEAWKYLKKVKILTLDEIQQVHSILMENDGAWSEPWLKDKHRGKFRDCPVYIGGHEAIHPYLIMNSLQEWCDDMNMLVKESLAEHDKELRSKDLHVEYERIHPFVDGNGRTGRMFMNWWNLRNNIPVIVIHEGEEQYDYYKWFE